MSGRSLEHLRALVGPAYSYGSLFREGDAKTIGLCVHTAVANALLDSHDGSIRQCRLGYSVLYDTLLHNFDSLWDIMGSNNLATHLWLGVAALRARLVEGRAGFIVDDRPQQVFMIRAGWIPPVRRVRDDGCGMPSEGARLVCSIEALAAHWRSFCGRDSGRLQTYVSYLWDWACVYIAQRAPHRPNDHDLGLVVSRLHEMQQECSLAFGDLLAPVRDALPMDFLPEMDAFVDDILAADVCNLDDRRDVIVQSLLRPGDERMCSLRNQAAEEDPQHIMSNSCTVTDYGEGFPSVNIDRLRPIIVFGGELRLSLIHI